MTESKSNIRLSQEELRRLHEQFLNDANIKWFQQQRLNIIQTAIPKYIIDADTKEMRSEYDPETQRQLTRLKDAERNYIESNYSQLNYKPEPKEELLDPTVRLLQIRDEMIRAEKEYDNED